MGLTEQQKTILRDQALAARESRQAAGIEYGSVQVPIETVLGLTEPQRERNEARVDAARAEIAAWMNYKTQPTREAMCAALRAAGAGGSGHSEAGVNDALGFIDQTIYANEDNPPDMTWVNEEVLELLWIIRNTLAEEVGPGEAAMRVWPCFECGKPIRRLSDAPLGSPAYEHVYAPRVVEHVAVRGAIDYGEES